MVAFFFAKSGHAFFKCSIPGKVKLLADIAYAIVFRNRKAAWVGQLITGNKLKKRSLAMTVPANNAYPLFGVKPEADVFEQRMAAKTFCKIFYINHELISS